MTLGNENKINEKRLGTDSFSVTRKLFSQSLHVCVSSFVATLLPCEVTKNKLLFSQKKEPQEFKFFTYIQTTKPIRKLEKLFVQFNTK